MRICFAALVLLLGAALAPLECVAQSGYPARPVRLVVPFPPGGGTDIIARLIAQKLAARLDQQLIVDNRPGAGTNIGMSAVAKAAPDGYTLLMGTITLAANSSLYKQLGFDPERDFAPITLVANSPTLLVTSAAFPARTVAELLDYMKRKPGEVNYASYGSGSGAHLAAELFRAATGADFVHVPYKGGGPAVAAILGGEAQVLFASVLPVLTQVKAGRLRPIALAAKRRLPVLPEVPTFVESGVSYETGTWFGTLAPAGTLRAIIARLHRETLAVLQAADMRERIAGEGAEIVGGGPEEFAAFIRMETVRWAGVVKAAGIQAE